MTSKPIRTLMILALVLCFGHACLCAAPPAIAAALIYPGVTPEETLLDASGRLSALSPSLVKALIACGGAEEDGGVTKASLGRMKRLSLAEPMDEPVDLSFLQFCGSLEQLVIACEVSGGTEALGLLQSLDTLNWKCEGTLDVSPLAHCAGLKRLSLESPAENLSALTALAQVEVLKLEGARGVDELIEAFAPKLTGLSVTSCDFSNFSGLSGAGKLTELAVKDCPVSDFSALRELKSLQALQLEELVANTLCDFEGASGVTELYLTHCVSPSVERLAESFPNVETLKLSRLGLMGVTGLERFEKLKVLEITQNGGISLTPIARLDGLEKLAILYCGIRDAHALEGMTGLKELELRYNELAELSHLGTLTGLEKLDLRDNPNIASYEPLERCLELQVLRLPDSVTQEAADRLVAALPKLDRVTRQKTVAEKSGRTDVSPEDEARERERAALLKQAAERAEITPASELTDRRGNVVFKDPNMEQAIRHALGVSDGAEVSQAMLLTLQNLTIAPVYGSQTDLSVLQLCTELRRLTCQVSPESLAPLCALSKLTELSLDGGAEFGELPFLPYTKHLHTLTLHGYLNEDITELAVLKELASLTLDGCAVRDLSALEGLGGLRALTVVNTPVESIAPITSLKELTRLTLEKTRVTDLSPVIGCPKLAGVNLRSPMADVSPLSSLPGLTSLTLTGVDEHNLHIIIHGCGKRLTWLDLRDLTLGADYVRYIQENRQLQLLSLQNVTISGVISTAEFEALTTLILYNVAAYDYNPLFDAPGLTHVEITGARGVNLEALARHEGLKALRLNRCELTDIGPLGTLGECTYLGLEGNQIASVAPLTSCEKLTYLSLSSAPKDLPALVRALPELTVHVGSVSHASPAQ